MQVAGKYSIRKDQSQIDVKELILTAWTEGQRLTLEALALAIEKENLHLSGA